MRGAFCRIHERVYDHRSIGTDSLAHGLAQRVHRVAYAGGRSYVADTENHVIRRIDLRTGLVTTVLGAGPCGDGPEPDPLQCKLSRRTAFLGMPRAPCTSATAKHTASACFGINGRGEFTGRSGRSGRTLVSSHEEHEEHEDPLRGLRDFVANLPGSQISLCINASTSSRACGY